MGCGLGPGLELARLSAESSQEFYLKTAFYGGYNRLPLYFSPLISSPLCLDALTVKLFY